MNDTVLQVYCNGEISYTIKGVHAKTSVIWRYRAPNGAGDTHLSVMRSTKSNLTIKQGLEEKYKPTLYIAPLFYNKDYELSLPLAFKKVQEKYPGIELKKTLNGIWQVIIPEKYKEDHEAHFGRVMEKFLDYLKNGNIPSWEVPNMIAKYFTTTKGLETALKNKQ